MSASRVLFPAYVIISGILTREYPSWEQYVTRDELSSGIFTPTVDQPHSLRHQIIAGNRVLQTLNEEQLLAASEGSRKHHRLKPLDGLAELLPFSKPASEDELAEVAREAYVTLDEATAACLGLHPERCAWSHIEPFVEEIPLAKRFQSLRSSLQRSMAKDKLDPQPSLHDVARWAHKRGLALPANLQAALKVARPQQDDSLEGKSLRSAAMIIHVLLCECGHDPQRKPSCAGWLEGKMRDYKLKLSRSTLHDWIMLSRDKVSEIRDE